MKVILTTLNAKFVHTSLALWYLYQYSRHDFPELVFREYNINQDLNWICGEIYLEQAPVIAFSCNIWNIEPVLTICRRIKALAPQTVFILGGPEVSADPTESWPRIRRWISLSVVRVRLLFTSGCKNI